VYGATLERASGVVVDAVGINGAHSIHFLSADATMLSEHLRHRTPDLIAVQLGTNMSNGLRPSTHGNRLATLVRRLQAAAPDAACVLVSPPDRARRNPDGSEGTPSYIPAVVAQTERVARETGCAFWSSYDAMGGSGSFVRWKALELAAADDSHLTRGGYARLARMLDTRSAATPATEGATPATEGAAPAKCVHTDAHPRPPCDAAGLDEPSSLGIRARHAPC